MEFVGENILSESPDIFVKLPRNNVTTFSTGKKVIVKDSKGKEINLKMNMQGLIFTLVVDCEAP